MIYRRSLLLLSTLLLMGCATNTATPVTDETKTLYKGEALLLLAIDGTQTRGVRFIEIASNEASQGYEIYFHDKKPTKGFIGIKIPAPSTNVYVKEYSLSGHYGCSRGKAGYGSGSKHIATVVRGKTYFLGTVNTSMNTMYNEMPKALISEAKSKYNYKVHSKDIIKSTTFKSNISL